MKREFEKGTKKNKNIFLSLCLSFSLSLSLSLSLFSLCLSLSLFSLDNIIMFYHIVLIVFSRLSLSLRKIIFFFEIFIYFCDGNRSFEIDFSNFISLFISFHLNI